MTAAKDHDFKPGRKVKILKGMRDAWCRRTATNIDVKLREEWTIEDVTQYDGSVGVRLGRAGRMLVFFVSAPGKLRREAVTLNTGDPTKTIKVALVEINSPLSKLQEEISELCKMITESGDGGVRNQDEIEERAKAILGSWVAPQDKPQATNREKSVLGRYADSSGVSAQVRYHVARLYNRLV